MTFVDTNVFMYAVGRAHPLREPSRRFFHESMSRGIFLVTSAEVLQELMHAYLPVSRIETWDAALQLVVATVGQVWPVEAEDLHLARDLADRHPTLQARDLVHLACCQRRQVRSVQTWDRGLRAVVERG